MASAKAALERKLYATDDAWAWWAYSETRYPEKHVVSVRVLDDGRIEPNCDCPGFYGHHKCWHAEMATAIAADREKVREFKEKKKMSNLALVKANEDAAAIVERVVLHGNLKDLTPAERVEYYRRVCDSIGLNPLTKPFEYIELQGKLTLYATRTATDQLRGIHGISVEIKDRQFMADAGLYVVTAHATTADGRSDESIGAVNVKNLSGENLANALMKAETKAKRRVTLGIAGLGWMDEIEASSTGGYTVSVDAETGEVQDAPPQRAQGRQRAPERPQEEEAPPWAHELGERMKEAGLKMADLAAELGVVPTRNTYADLVTVWLTRHPGCTVADLVLAALDGVDGPADEGEGDAPVVEGQAERLSFPE